MKEKEFADVVLDCDILTKKELCDLVKCFNSVLNVPVGFSAVKRCGLRQRLSRFETGQKCKSWHYGSRYSGNCDSIILSVSKNIKLNSVRLFGSENNEYSVTLVVYEAAKCDALATKTGKFMSELIQSEGGDYHGFDIVFEPPITLKANIKYFFETSIFGPPSWYGRGGKSHVEHFGLLTFSFQRPSGCSLRTTVEQGQFSEFEFSTLD